MHFQGVHKKFSALSDDLITVHNLMPVCNGIFFKVSFLNNCLNIYQTQCLKNLKQKYLILTK